MHLDVMQQRRVVVKQVYASSAVRAKTPRTSRLIVSAEAEKKSRFQAAFLLNSAHAGKLTGKPCNQPLDDNLNLDIGSSHSDAA
ncbi:hypothetical protein [Nevskia ramosa]|uniref:hypothetical protein n=1 Tax=Nevskia ramosa TaxID=64002 RepID=UPI002352E731|nr:hypothetical protein [Nevskia ramosa]